MVFLQMNPDRSCSSMSLVSVAEEDDLEDGVFDVLDFLVDNGLVVVVARDDVSTDEQRRGIMVDSPFVEERLIATQYSKLQNLQGQDGNVADCSVSFNPLSRTGMAHP